MRHRKQLKHIFFHTLDCGGADLRRFGSPFSYSPISSDGIMYFDGNDLVRRGPNGGLSSNPGIINLTLSFRLRIPFKTRYVLSAQNAQSVNITNNVLDILINTAQKLIIQAYNYSLWGRFTNWESDIAQK